MNFYNRVINLDNKYIIYIDSTFEVIICTEEKYNIYNEENRESINHMDGGRMHNIFQYIKELEDELKHYKEEQTREKFKIEENKKCEEDKCRRCIVCNGKILETERYKKTRLGFIHACCDCDL